MLVGPSIIFVPLVTYATYVNSIPILDARTAVGLEDMAYLMLLLTLVGLVLSAFGVSRLLRNEVVSRSKGTLVVMGRVLHDTKHRSIMSIATFAYGVVFAFVSGIIVYRPSENFGTEYLVSIPSTIMTVCCGSPGFVPVLTVYLTNHLGFLIIPMDIVLLTLVSGLVGLNITLLVGQIENRPRKSSARWFLGVGAACGLFTACPTCAGLLLSTTILSVGSSAVILLSGMQPFFILATALALALGTVLSARTLQLNSELPR